MTVQAVREAHEINRHLPRRKPNTVLGIPEPEFRKGWVAVLWQAMAKTGRGYRRHTLKNQPLAGASHWRGERRADKVGTSKIERRLALQRPVSA